MRTELERIEEQLRLCFEGPAWHGPSVLEALDGVSAGDAHRRPVAGAHTIWEIVHHLAGTYRLVLRRLKGDATPLSPDEDWPRVPEPNEATWTSAVQTLRHLNTDLRRLARGFYVESLDTPLVPVPDYSAYQQLIGITQHDLYHAGQIVLLRRASV